MSLLTVFADFKLSFRLRRVLAPILIAIIVASVTAYSAEKEPSATTKRDAQCLNDPKALSAAPTLVTSTIIENKSVEDVAKTVLDSEPQATVLVPETETTRSNDIKPQQADALNTVLIAVDNGYCGAFFFISPKYTWLQSIALNGFNLVYLQQMDLKLGRWSMILQKGGRLFVKGLYKVGLVSSLESPTAERFGNYITHGLMMYVYYSLFQMMALVPDLHQGVFSAAAQANIFRKAGAAFLSGFGWTMTARKWDSLPDDQRPIRRQAFSSFNNFRGVILGIFIPILIGTSNDASTLQFLMYNSPFFISAAFGTTVYFFGDKLLERYPKIGEAFARFDLLTQKLNQKISPWVNSTISKIKSACSWPLTKNESNSDSNSNSKN